MKRIIFSLALVVAMSSIYGQTASDYRAAAERGDKEAQYNLGVCYNNGYGVTKDFTQAVYWFRKAAEQGDATAQYNLGVCYEYGQGVPENKNHALYWYEKVAAGGYDNASKYVAELKAKGYRAVKP